LEEMMSFGGNVGGSTVGRGLLMALVACMVVRGINPFRTGGIVMFEVHYERDWHFFEVSIPRLHLHYCGWISFSVLVLTRLWVDSIFYNIGCIWRHLRRYRD
jgi:hypothetical protein